MVVCADIEMKKQAIKDAQLAGIYSRSAENDTNDAQDSYSWYKANDASEEDSGALELLTRNINQPGITQDAGVVLAVGLENGLIEFASPNTQRYLGLELQEVLGTPPASLFACSEEEFEAAMESSERAIPATHSMRLAKMNRIADVSFSRSKNGIVIDIEEIHESAEFDHAQATRTAVDAPSALSQIGRKEETFSWIVNTVMQMVSFDRVTLYMFHPDQHGEVVAEALRPGCPLESCNGVHYAATKIPQRARDLFLLSPVRSIADTCAEQLELAASPSSRNGDADADAKLPTSIYLTTSALRGVHPCHIEYLQTIKITATLTFAVVLKGRLWGLITCSHGSGPRTVPRPVRQACWDVVQAFSSRLSEMEQQEREERSKVVAEAQAALLGFLGEDAKPNLLGAHLHLLCSVVQASGVALVEKEGDIYKSGAVPTDNVIRKICTHTAHETERAGVLAIDSLSEQLALPPPSSEGMAGCAGMLVVKVIPRVHLLWFRQEIVHEVRWSADHNKSGRPKPSTAGEAFEQWVEEVRGTCRRWSHDDCQDAQQIALAIDDGISARSLAAEFVTETNGRILRWNSAMAELSGLKAELAVGKLLPEVCAVSEQREVATWLASFRNARRAERRLQLNVCTHPASALAFVSAKSSNALALPTLRFRAAPEPEEQRGSPDRSVFGEAGGGVGFAGEEIRGTKAVGQVYQLPAAFSCLDEVSTPHWIMDANPAQRVFLWCNAETCKVLQLSKPEFHCLDLQPDLVDARVMQMWFERVQLGQQILRGNHVFYNKGASVAMEVEVSPIRVQTLGGKVQTVCLVSARGVGAVGEDSPCISEAAMRSHEMLQVSKVMMMLFQESGQMIDSNLSAKVYYSLALAKEDISLWDVFESCEWATTEECKEAYQQMFAVCREGSGKIFELERVKRHMQSGVVHLLQFSSARDPETGEFAISVNETDISRMKSVQNKLIAAQQQQERFLAATSHELRTPLHAILALSGSLLRDQTLGPQAVRILKLIQSSGHSLTTLVDDILDAAALRAGVLVLKNEVVNLGQVVGNVFEVCGLMVARGVQIINDVPADIGPILSDAARLTQILMNLVGNSVKFTATGFIKIAASMDTARSQVHISVADSGKGVPADKLSHIWEAFGQAECGAGGTGLGLTIVRSLVTKMGGVIRLESSTAPEDHGTVFTVVLPVRRMPDEQLPEGCMGRTPSSGAGAGAGPMCEDILNRSGNPTASPGITPGSGVDMDGTVASPWGGSTLYEGSAVPSLGGGAPTQERESEREREREKGRERGREREREWEREREKERERESAEPMESHTRKALAQTRQQLMEAQEKMRLQDRLVQSLQAELKHALLAGSNAPALSPSPSPAPAPLHEKEQEAASHLAASTTQEVFLLGELALSEAERRALEVAECSVRRLSLEQAMAAVAAERALPAAVLLDAASLGAQLERACAWAHTLFEVPLVLLASGDAQAKRAAALGCAGTLQTPLVAAELVAELRRQEEARRLWLQPSVLSSCAAPVSACAAARARRLRAGKGGAVRAHGRLVAVALLFEVRVLDGAEASSEAMLSLCQLVLKRCEELVAGAAGRHGALVTEAGGDRFTVVAGHDGRGMAEGWEGCVGAAHRVAVDAEHTLRREEARFKERGVCVSLRAGVGAGRGYEGLVGCAQEQFAFFGEPVAEAWRCAGMAGEAQMGMSSETMALLFPGDLKGESSEARGEGCSADASLRFVSLRADTEAAAAAVGGGASSASSSCALRSEQQSLSFAHFASQLPRSQSQEASQRGHTLSHLELRLVSKVLERSGAAQARQQSWGAAAVVQGQMSLGRWDGKLEPEPESEGARTVRVLSVDDNPVNQVVIESALLPLGHDVLTCMDTLDVFAMLEKMERLPDIILLDVMLPSGSGLDVLKELRKTYSSTDLPIILVSGRSSKDSIIEGLEAGGNDYIVKPFDTSELVCRINTQLNVSAMVQVRLELARRSELLNKMLPREIVPKILAGETPIHQHMGQASFLVVEIVGFSELSQQVHTVELVELLSALYADFDRLCDKHDVFKVESAADSYIVATGHTADCCDDENHTTKLVHIGLDMIRHARRYINAVSGSFLEVSLGISSGPTSAGVVSAKLPHYCFFGNTINTAKKMQLHGFPSTITVSVSAKAMIEKSVECVSLGIRVIPGSGPVETFVVRHKLTPWERAVESACHGHNFVGYADGTRIRGTPASRLRRVGSPEGPQSASCRTRSYEGSGEGDSENSETGLEGAGARGLAKMERSASDGPQRRPRHRPASRSSRRIASAASTEVGELPRTPRAEPKVETREEGCQAGLETQTALVVAKAAPATPPCRPPEEDPLEELLARARLPHLLEELVANGVDVGTLAHSTESELESLGVRVKGERLKVLRYARAWQTIYG